SKYLEVVDSKEAKVKNLELWGKYAIVTDEERDYHKGEKHSVVFEQVLNYDHSNSQVGSGQVNAGLHWTGAVRYIAFGMLNKTAEKYNNHSNYTTDAHDSRLGRSPIKTVSLQYDAQQRYQNMPADMFSEVEMMDTFTNGTPHTGIHAMSYALDPSDNT